MKKIIGLFVFVGFLGVSAVSADHLHILGQKEIDNPNFADDLNAQLSKEIKNEYEKGKWACAKLYRIDTLKMVGAFDKTIKPDEEIIQQCRKKAIFDIWLAGQKKVKNSIDASALPLDIYKQLLEVGLGTMDAQAVYEKFQQMIKNDYQECKKACERINHDNSFWGYFSEQRKPEDYDLCAKKGLLDVLLKAQQK